MVTRYYVKAVWDGVVDVDDRGHGPDAAIAAARDWLMDGLDLGDLARGSVAEVIPEEKLAEWDSGGEIAVTSWQPQFGLVAYEYDDDDEAEDGTDE